MKLSELGSWFSRRNKSPRAVAGAFSRGNIITINWTYVLPVCCLRNFYYLYIIIYCTRSLYYLLWMFVAWWRWQHKYLQPKKAGIAPFFQVTAASMLFFYVINYGKTSKLTNYHHKIQSIKYTQYICVPITSSHRTITIIQTHISLISSTQSINNDDYFIYRASPQLQIPLNENHLSIA